MARRKSGRNGSGRTVWSYPEVLGFLLAFGVSAVLWLIIILVALALFPG